MRLDHIIISVHNSLNDSFLSCAPFNRIYMIRIKLLLNASGHSGEAIPVPIPNTEVKLSYADDTAL